MRVEETKVEALTIRDAERLDPVLVILQDFGGGAGRLVAECFGSAWSTYWGGMGPRTLREFICSCEPDYIANRLFPEKQRRTKHEYAYVMRIVAAIQTALRPAEQHTGGA